MLTVTTSSAQERTIRLFCAALDSYPPFRVDVVELFDKALVARGYRVDWAMVREEPGPGGIERWADRTYVLRAHAAPPGSLHGLRQALSWIPFSLRLARQLYTGQYDILQARDTSALALPMLVLARLTGARFTFWMSRPIGEDASFGLADPLQPAGWLKRALRAPFARWSRWLLFRHVLLRTDHIFVQSKRMAAELIAKGIDHKRITPVPIAIDLQELEAAVRDHSDPFLGRKAIVHLGSLARARRPEILIDVLSAVRKRVPDALLALIGDASESDMAFLKSYVAGAGLERQVIVTGRMAREHALKLARHAAVCLLAIPPEPHDQAAAAARLLECLALGRPVVTSDAPDLASMIEESGAGLVAAYEAEALAEAVSTLLSDPARAEAMGARGLDFVHATRTTTSLAARIDEIYRALLRQSEKTLLKPATAD